jgi:xanthine dehydrogenase accessory factor
MVCFLNKIEVLPRLWVFGAGHVGTALAPIAQSAGFRVTVVDERVEWAVPSRFPGEVEVLDAEPTDLLRRQPLEPADYAVVVTHSHPLDEALIQAISSAPPAYVGLIGSRAKWARFRARLAERGVEPAFLDRVRCPVGADIGAATPGEIAVSIAAELVAVKRRVPQT